MLLDSAELIILLFNWLDFCTVLGEDQKGMEFTGDAAQRDAASVPLKKNIY